MSLDATCFGVNGASSREPFEQLSVKHDCQMLGGTVANQATIFFQDGDLIAASDEPSSGDGGRHELSASTVGAANAHGEHVPLEADPPPRRIHPMDKVFLRICICRCDNKSNGIVPYAFPKISSLNSRPINIRRISCVPAPTV